MIIETDLIRAVNERLRQAFQVEYKEIDIEEGFTRPCLTVDIDDYKTDFVNTEALEEEIPVTIFYFAEKTKDARREILKVREKIKSLFSKPFEIKEGFFVFSNEIDFNINYEDKSLITTLYFPLIYQTDHLSIDVADAFDNDEYMEELNIKIKET